MHYDERITEAEDLMSSEEIDSYEIHRIDEHDDDDPSCPWCDAVDIDDIDGSSAIVSDAGPPEDWYDQDEDDPFHGRGESYAYEAHVNEHWNRVDYECKFCGDEMYGIDID